MLPPSDNTGWIHVIDHLVVLETSGRRESRETGRSRGWSCLDGRHAEHRGREVNPGGGMSCHRADAQQGVVSSDWTTCGSRHDP